MDTCISLQSELTMCLNLSVTAVTKVCPQTLVLGCLYLMGSTNPWLTK